jgi:non-heme chloroperoxidase
VDPVPAFFRSLASASGDTLSVLSVSALTWPHSLFEGVPQPRLLTPLLSVASFYKYKTQSGNRPHKHRMTTLSLLILALLLPSAITPKPTAIHAFTNDSVELAAYQSKTDTWKDSSPHKTRVVTVEPQVRLEVLDWGGSGRPLVLLAGGGNTAHVFDEFAPKLTASFHVFGITRRGFGTSEFSDPDNVVDRLRDDVLAVLNALKLERPVLVGHSIAGTELSAVANSQRDRVAGLIYLEAGYPYAFNSSTGPGMNEFMRSAPQSPKPGPTDLATFKSLQAWDVEVFGIRRPESELRQTWDTDASGRPLQMRNPAGAKLFGAILTSDKGFTTIPVPSLFIIARSHSPEKKSNEPPIDEAARTYYASLDAATDRQAKAIEQGVPTASVIRLRGNHHIFLSNETEVLREMRIFLASLK